MLTCHRECRGETACVFLVQNKPSAPAYFYGQQEPSSLVLPPHAQKKLPTSSWATIARFPESSSNPPPVSSAPVSAPPPVNLPSTSVWKSTVPCKFFASSSCLQGDKCKFAHILVEDPVFSHASCGICLESLVHRRIGVLESCDHLFCLDCIKNWRASNDEDVGAPHVQTCPVCRIRSFFVVPSHRLPRSGEDKRGMISDFKLNCQQIPCRYGKQCPFQRACFYRHAPNDFDSAKLDLEFVKTADGVDRALSKKGAATLGEYFLH